MKNKIILYNPKPNPDLMSKDIPMALLCASKVISKEPYEVKILSDLSGKENVVKWVDNALLFGITSLTGYQIVDGLSVAQMVRDKYPDIPIVWGGWHPTLHYEQTIEDPLVDIIVRGQGEKTLSELAGRLQRGEDLEGLLGVTYKKDGKIYHNECRPFEDLDNFPPIPFHLVDIKNHIYGTEFGTRSVNFISAQGCPHKCGFCCEQGVTKRRWYPLSAPRMVEEIEHLINIYDINGLIFNESNFFTSEKRVAEFCRGYIERGLHKKARWGNANGVINTMLHYKDETWELIRDSGCYSVLTGAESGYQPALDLIGKPNKAHQNVEFIKKCKGYGLKVLFSTMVGLPWVDVTQEERERLERENLYYTLKDIRRCLAVDSRSRGLLFTYTPYPFTPLYPNALKCGFKPLNSFREWGYFGHHTKAGTAWVPAQIKAFVTMLTTYIFLFLDTDLKKWILSPTFANTQNKFIIGGSKIVMAIFTVIARWRWEHNFFKFMVDYKLYRFIRKFQRVV